MEQTNINYNNLILILNWDVFYIKPEKSIWCFSTCGLWRYCMSCSVLFYHCVITLKWWREEVNFQWDYNEVRFFLDEHAELDFYIASSFNQQSAGRHVTPLGHIILIPNQRVFVLTTWSSKRRPTVFCRIIILLHSSLCLKVPVILEPIHCAPRIRVMVFNAIFKNISAISCLSVLMVEETEYLEKTTDLPQVTDKLYPQIQQF
jgi:hypothetical protein